MYFMTPDGNYVYSPGVQNLGGIMQPHDPMSPMLPSDIGTPTYSMSVGMPDQHAVLNGGQFNDPMLCGFGAVQDAINALSVVDFLANG